MPIIKSAKKAIRVAARRKVFNDLRKEAMKNGKGKTSIREKEAELRKEQIKLGKFFEYISPSTRK